MAVKGRLHTLFSAEEIAGRIEAMAGAIARDLGPSFLAIPILKGSFIFAADLMRALHRAGAAPEIDFLTLGSYGTGQVSGGTVRVVRDVEAPIAGAKVLLIDDILESGRTLAFAKDLMTAREAQSVHVCVLLEKRGKLAVQVAADYVGFDCPDRFVVGYGMDVAHAYRQLPYVGWIET